MTKLTMGIEIFYCTQIPVFDLAEIEWLIQIPSRDKELEKELGQQVWIVEYDAGHPDMQFHNRHETCLSLGFSGTVFEDEVIIGNQSQALPSQEQSIPMLELA